MHINTGIHQGIISGKFRYFIYNSISIYLFVWLCIFASGYVFPYNSFVALPAWGLGENQGAKRTIPIISQTVLVIKRLVEKLLCLHKFRIPKYSCIFWNTGLDTVDLDRTRIFETLPCFCMEERLTSQVRNLTLGIKKHITGKWRHRITLDLVIIIFILEGAP